MRSIFRSVPHYEGDPCSEPLLQMATFSPRCITFGGKTCKDDCWLKLRFWTRIWHDAYSVVALPKRNHTKNSSSFEDQRYILRALHNSLTTTSLGRALLSNAQTVDHMKDNHNHSVSRMTCLKCLIETSQAYLNSEKYRVTGLYIWAAIMINVRIYSLTV